MTAARVHSTSNARPPGGRFRSPCTAAIFMPHRLLNSATSHEDGIDNVCIRGQTRSKQKCVAGSPAAAGSCAFGAESAPRERAFSADESKRRTPKALQPRHQATVPRTMS